MTLVLEGTPSSGGPRCLRSRGADFSLEPFSAVSFVVSVRGRTWPGTFVGAPSAGAASVNSTWSAPSAPSAFYTWLAWCFHIYLLIITYATATALTGTAATATTTSTSGGTAASLVGTFGTATSALGVSLRSAGQLDGDLALENGLAVELGDGTLRLGRGGESHESISDRARCAGVGGDGDRLTYGMLVT